MEHSQSLPDWVTFRDASPANRGRFMLHKSLLVVDGVNTPYSGRCDSLTYSMELPTVHTPYHDEGMYMGETSPYTGMPLGILDIQSGVKVIDAAPHFVITYVAFYQNTIDGNTFATDDLFHTSGAPCTIWFGTSIIELLKNMREWSFMVEEPFNSDHPMAIYSKLALDILEIPLGLLHEIDSLPDMHLARYLKGDVNHRQLSETYPQMSPKMMAWFKEKQQEFAPKETTQMLREIEI
jgi:hypothetical protein